MSVVLRLRKSRLLFHTTTDLAAPADLLALNLDPAARKTEESNSTDYSEDYYRGGPYSDYLADRQAIQRNAARVLAELEQMVEGRRPPMSDALRVSFLMVMSRGCDLQEVGLCFKLCLA
jgi:hypothetical protein